MSEFRKCRGRTIGRVLHALDTYIDKPGLVQYLIIGSNEGKGSRHEGYVQNGHRGPMIAGYDWEGEDTPVFSFYGAGDVTYEQAERWELHQFFRRPFLDDEHGVRTMMIGQTVQHVSRNITLQDARTILWVIRKHGSKWDGLDVGDLKERLQKLTLEGSNGYIHAWEHAAECAVYDL